MKDFHLEIRSFSPQDEKSIKTLISKIQREEFNIPISVEDQPDLSNVTKFYQKNNGNFWVATLNNDIIGTIGLLDIGNQQLVLRKMFVKSEYRGKLLGVAQKLLNTVLHWSKEKMTREIFLGTTSQFVSAHKFYEKNGFELINKKYLPYSFPIMKVDTRFYKKFIIGNKD